MLIENQPFIFKTGFENMNFDKVTDMLKDAYWSVGIKKEEVMQGAQFSALLVGVFNENSEQIGYARAISDKTRVAYVSDVIVDERYRKQGIGRKMVEFMMKSAELNDVYHWILYTNDAHGVYSKLGFKSFTKPELWMEVNNGRPKR